LRLLLVDDDRLLSKSLREVLEGDGHSVHVADGGQKGIDEFLSAHGSPHAFSLVITDLGMPYVDGRQVAAAVKKASPDTPVIMLTGWGRRLLADQEVPAHVDRLLSKPPRLSELRTALAQLTGPPRSLTREAS
jgi:CheY-like chemotaxis protein